MELIDTHCHLQFEQLAAKLDSVLKDAQKAAVTGLVCVGTSVSDSQKAIDIAQAQPNVWASVGVHPHDAVNFFGRMGAPKTLKRLLDQPKVVAIGEIGLDFYKNYSPKPLQEKLLRLQIELGIPTDLPFIFHVRDAWSDFWRIYDSYQPTNRRLHGVVHSFSASEEQLEEALSRDLHVALNGIMTFTSDQTQLEAAQKVPKDKLLLETDAPFLAPKSYRGKTCEPKHILDIADFLAGLRDEPIEELAGYTTKNARGLFGI
jgi:TatD DNase family protein